MPTPEEQSYDRFVRIWSKLENPDEWLHVRETATRFGLDPEAEWRQIVNFWTFGHINGRVKPRKKNKRGKR